MDLIETLKAVGSTAGFGALLTSLFNFYTLRKQQGRMLEIEAFRKNSAVDTFRYTKLFEASAEIQALPPVTYDLSNIKKVVAQTAERHGLVQAIYKRVQPLIGASCRTDADRVADEEAALSKKLVEHLYGGGEEVPIKELLLKRQEFEQMASMAISSSLTALTISQ